LPSPAQETIKNNKITREQNNFFIAYSPFQRVVSYLFQRLNNQTMRSNQQTFDANRCPFPPANNARSNLHFVPPATAAEGTNDR
ncbi:MAG: hypothetical protein ACK2UP_05765, partial [Candidatus Promineifilaceae bacterium]